MLTKTMKNRAHFIMTALVILLAAAACADRNIVWQQNVTVHDCLWNKDSILTFNISAEDTLAWYALSVYVRNRTDYGFQNLYIFLDVKAPNGNSTVDTLNFMLAFDSGQWTGTGGVFSKFRENNFLYRDYIRFPERGTYAVNIRHGMRKDNLEGISSVGLTLIHSGN
jgi:gliding motility-associated lipoprotein GldH